MGQNTEAPCVGAAQTAKTQSAQCQVMQLHAAVSRWGRGWGGGGGVEEGVLGGQGGLGGHSEPVSKVPNSLLMVGTNY